MTYFILTEQVANDPNGQKAESAAAIMDSVVDLSLNQTQIVAMRLEKKAIRMVLVQGKIRTV